MVEKIFAAINAAIVVGFGIYVFKRFLMPAIQDAIKVRLMFVKNLQDTHKQLKLEQRKLDEEIENQERACQELSTKIKHWKEVFYAETINRIEQDNLYRESLVSKFQIQLKNRAIEIAQRQITPRLIGVLEHELSAYYKHREHARHYVNHALDYLHENRS